MNMMKNVAEQTGTRHAHANGHTHGPWYRDYGGGYGRGHVYADAFPKNCIGGREAMAVAHFPGLTDANGLTKEAFDMMEANAQLMTAAPEMFAALEHILADLEMKHPDLRLPAPVESRIRAAIAKATDRVED
jgi:hypothetical protein